MGEATAKRRVGSMWLELKYIRDAGSGRTYGPYVYGVGPMARVWAQTIEVHR